MRLRALVAASDPIAEEAAQSQLAQGGSAVASVIAGYFAAAGSYAGVLLSPLSMLVVGIGAGGRAFDGRSRQPGQGTKRPRGFLEGEEAPLAARVAIPASVAALAVAHAYDGGKSLGTLVKPGIARAERAGADSRAELLSRIRAVGHAALTEQAFTRPFLRLAGPSEGGLVTPSDFGKIGDLDLVATTRELPAGLCIEPPWSAEVSAAPAQELGIGAAICAVDVRGVFAAVAYFRATEGLDIEDLALIAPFVAVPTRRGVQRQAPGTSLPAPAAIAVRATAEGQALQVYADPASGALDLTRKARISLLRDPVTREVELDRN
ncbi:MAG TPA: hypothetical protein VGI10_12465 [Polyangiaceae bacterium]|jgi:hypothetical protein